VGEGGPRQTRLAVVHSAHGVEEVRDAGHPTVEGAVGLFEGDVGVSGGDDHPAVGGELHEPSRPIQLGRQRDHAHRPQVQEVGEQVLVGTHDVGSGMGPPLLQAYEGPFEVDAENLGPRKHAIGVPRGAYLRQDLLVEGLGGGDDRREVRGRPGREQGS
jgi:hypothetical protein